MESCSHPWRGKVSILVEQLSSRLLEVPCAYGASQITSMDALMRILHGPRSWEVIIVNMVHTSGINHMTTHPTIPYYRQYHSILETSKCYICERARHLEIYSITVAFIED